MLKIISSLQTQQEDILNQLRDYQIDICHEDKSLIETITKKSYDVILLENKIESIKEIKTVDPRIEVIIFGTNGTVAVEAIKIGASAFFRLPLNSLEPFKNTIDNINEDIKLRIETAELEKQLYTKYMFKGVVGKNPKMLEIFNFMRRIAPYFQTVTIIGETGTGKEGIAKAIQLLSPVAKHPFITCNSGSLGKDLIESELFGHKRGSFTGAIADKSGLFAAAGEGIIFLDEIGELPLQIQPHLLRVLQDGEYRQVGSNQTMKANCKVIAATNCNLLEEVKNGRFREDLYYRLTPLTITLPPLRERKDDISLLCRHFLENFSKRTGKNILGISRPAQTALFNYDWPGNVRTLENVLERASMLTSESFIRLEDLPAYISETNDKKPVLQDSIDDIVKKHVIEVLHECSGNRSKAAEKLKISRRALLRKIEKYNISC
ncbi:MAG: sigma-54 dependent transcriptional regulator [Thermodesulfovibrionales bacterium]|jgi:DNA-binding NtrC family response regulator